MATYSLSGSGVQTLNPGVGQLQVHVTTVPGDVGFGRANPSNLYGVGFITPSDGTVYWRPQPIDAAFCWLGLPLGTTKFGYSLLGGATADVTEVFADNPFRGSPGAIGATGATGAAGATGPAGQGVPTGGTTGQVLTKNSATDFDDSWQTPSAGGAHPTIQLDYVETADLFAGTALAATTWTDVFPNKSFTCSGGITAVFEFILRSGMLIGDNSPTAGLGFRLVIDSAGTPINMLLGGAFRAGVVNPYINPAMGGAAVFRSGLSAGAHTVKLQVYSTTTGNDLYCRPATNPNTEMMALQVVEW